MGKPSRAGETSPASLDVPGPGFMVEREGSGERRRSCVLRNESDTNGCSWYSVVAPGFFIRWFTRMDVGDAWEKSPEDVVVRRQGLTMFTRSYPRISPKKDREFIGGTPESSWVKNDQYSSSQGVDSTFQFVLRSGTRQENERGDKGGPTTRLPS
ncbi:hypothetical protein C8R42DRAFT_640357 [Lentinula raphanica]|nr:hypothetical protein C8R42DRAFT_640357 [Lentinula raphanica]